MQFLIGLGRSSSVSLRVLADQLERGGDHVAVHELDLEARSGLDPLLALVDDARPQQIGLCCSLWSAVPALELCRRLRALWPGVAVLLWGGAAPWIAGQLEGVGVIPGREVLAGLGGRPAPDVIPFCRERLDELVRGAARFRTPVTVERLSGAPLPLHQLRGNGLSPNREGQLAVEQAVEWIGPLLRAGLAVRVEEPALTADRRAVERLLEEVGSERLVLELPAELLDRALAQQLVRVGVQQLELDLTGLALEGPDPPALADALRGLADAGVAVRGNLVYGHPTRDPAGLGATVDRCLALGVEDLALRRLVVPPDSPLRRHPDLVLAETPPYEVLAHAGAGPVELARCVRLTATLDMLRESLAGTGVLRALCESSLSAFEVLEGFGESLAARGPAGLERGHRGVERGFSEYLRLHHGVDLEGGQGQLRLVRSPGLFLRWLGNGSRLVTDESTGREAHMGRGALALIDRCDRAQTLHELCEQLVVEAPASRRARLRRELRITVDKLTTMGFLVPAAEGGFASGEPPFTNLDEFDYHYRMLMDSTRVEAYRRAINRVVRPGQHVVEVGTGTGILAALAAQAGARVTAIERYAVLEMAREVVRRSGVEDRVEFIRGRSDLVAVDEPADLLLTELVGNRILNEGLLEVTLDARQRMLRPGAQLLPRRIAILAQLCFSGRFAHLARELERLAGRYRVDLSPLAEWVQASMAAGTLIWEQGADEGQLETLSDEAVAVDLDLRRIESAEFSSEFALQARRGGEINAVVLSFVLDLHDGIELTTRGRQHNLHWNRPVIMLPVPVAVLPGDKLRFRLSYELGTDIRLVQLD